MAASLEAQEKRRLVVADDSELVLDMIRDIFEAIGFEVYTIPTAIGLRGLLYKVRPEVIILDVNMPAIPGSQAIDGAKAICPNARIVFFSDDPITPQLAAKHGVSWLSKHAPDGGYHPERLVAAVMRSSGRHVKHKR